MRAQWLITDHVCRACYGRVLQLSRADGVKSGEGRVHRCSNCGLQREGGVTEICVCGIKVGKAPRQQSKLHCIRNDKPTSEFPAEIVAMEIKP